METSYTKQLVESGLTQNQAILYELLIKSGPLRASNIVRRLGNSLSRPMVYLILNELVSLGLVEKDLMSGKVARFIPAHPTRIQDIAETRRKNADLVADAAASLIPRIVSEYNLATGKPEIYVYEGIKGIEKVLNDSLTSKTIIYTYADIESVVKNIDEINRQYATKRDSLGINKKAILLDTPFAREYMKGYHQEVTDIKLVSVAEAPPFKSALEIYDGKVAYITFAPDKMIGVIIHDPYLYEMHKYMFEYTWGKA